MVTRARIKKLEAENDELRQALTQLTSPTTKPAPMAKSALCLRNNHVHASNHGGVPNR